MLSKWLLRSTRRICISTLRPTQLRISSIRGFADDASSTESRTSAEGLTAKQLPQQDGEVPEFFNFTLSCPHKELYTDSPVRMVAVPGSEGRFAATPGHIPVIAELQPGILSLYHERSETSGRQDHYFVSGGMALIHPNSVMEIAAVECVNLSDMDANVSHHHICISFHFICYIFVCLLHRTFARVWQKQRRNWAKLMMIKKLLKLKLKLELMKHLN